MSTLPIGDLQAILNRKLAVLFPDHAHRRAANSALNEYGTEAHEQEPVRVRLAILKLAGGSIDKLQKNTTFAKQDFRDILVWAEYPRQANNGSFSDNQKRNKLIEADREEYRSWLDS